MGLTKSDLDGQFVLTQHSQFIPEQWQVQEKGAWLLGTHPSLPITNEQVENWLYRTGYCLSTGKRQLPLRKLDVNRVLLPGMAGEVGRGFYWRKGDQNKIRINAEELLNRCYLPAQGKILKETQKWLSELSDFNIFIILDLMYLEQRLGCWAAPQQYAGDNCSVCILYPFSHRQIFESMLRLPIEYKWKQQLAFDICQMADAELVKLPFNDFTGLLKYPKLMLQCANTFVKKTRLVIARPEILSWFLRSFISLD